MTLAWPILIMQSTVFQSSEKFEERLSYLQLFAGRNYMFQSLWKRSINRRFGKLLQRNRWKKQSLDAIRGKIFDQLIDVSSICFSDEDQTPARTPRAEHLLAGNVETKRMKLGRLRFFGKFGILDLPKNEIRNSTMTQGNALGNAG